MSNFSTEREIAKFFALSSVNIRLDACQIILEKVRKMVYSDEKREFLNKFLKYFKEWQSLNQKSTVMAHAQYASMAQSDSAVLDSNTAQKIISTIGLSNSRSPSKRQMAPYAEASDQKQKKSFGSFKSMKRDKQRQIQKDQIMLTESAVNGDPIMENIHSEANELDQIRKDVESMYKEEQKNQEPLFNDKILNELMKKNVYLNDFQEFPKAIVSKNCGLDFTHYLNHKSIRDVNEARMDYFAQRLAQAEERVFSHVEIYQRAKLSKTDKDAGFTTVYNVHSVLGSSERKWVLGLIL